VKGGIYIDGEKRHRLSQMRSIFLSGHLEKRGEAAAENRKIRGGRPRRESLFLTPVRAAPEPASRNYFARGGRGDLKE